MEARRGNTVLAVPSVESEEAGPEAPVPDPGGGAEPLRTRHPVAFTASAEEYFRLWIVNLALSIVTLGIYSAWAKVRKKRYFYGHTLIDGEAFEYRGNPVAILKGRIVAFLLLVMYSAGTEFLPILTPVFMLALAIVGPWLMVRSLAFNAWNSAYRNVQFHFRGRYAEALGVLVGNGLLVFLSLGLVYPYWKARLARFVASHHCYGATHFHLPSLTYEFYRVYFKAAFLLLGVMAFGLLVLVMGASAGGRSGTWLAVSGAVLVLFFYAGLLLAHASIRARVTNLTWNNAALGTVRFESTLQTGRLALIYFTNILAIIASVGLAIPWAVVRTMRYRCEHTTVIAEGGLDHFRADESANVGATGEAVGEFFNIDIAL